MRFLRGLRRGLGGGGAAEFAFSVIFLSFVWVGLCGCNDTRYEVMMGEILLVRSGYDGWVWVMRVGHYTDFGIMRAMKFKS